MSEIIPLTSQLPAYTQQATLDNVIYNLRVEWSTVNECWSLGFLNSNGEPVENIQRQPVYGIKLVVNYDVLQWIQSYNVPPGALIALDTSGNRQEAGRFDLGNRVQLIYIPKQELEEAG